MNEFLFFFIGLLLGGSVSFVILCSIQLNRINAYEAEIRKLKAQISKEGKHQ